MWMSGLCWMELGSWEKGRGWLWGNLELILGNNADVHGMITLTGGNPSLLLKERLCLGNFFQLSLLVFPGITPFINFAAAAFPLL